MPISRSVATISAPSVSPQEGCWRESAWCSASPQHLAHAGGCQQFIAPMRTFIVPLPHRMLISQNLLFQILQRGVQRRVGVFRLRDLTAGMDDGRVILPPKWRPISGYDASVISRQRYIAICRDAPAFYCAVWILVPSSSNGTGCRPLPGCLPSRRFFSCRR